MKSTQSQTPISLLIRLWGHLSDRRKRHFCLLTLLMCLSSLVEVVSIGAVIPFLGALVDPENVFNQPFLNNIFVSFGYVVAREIVVPITISFALVAVMSGLVRMFVQRATIKFSFSVGAEISSEIYIKTLYQPYIVHVSRNSSEIISGITNKVNELIYSALMPALVALSSSILLVAVLAALMRINFIVSSVVGLIFAVVYYLIVKLIKRRLILDSKNIAIESTKMIKLLQEGLGGIRDILIDRTQLIYGNIYSQSDKILRESQGSKAFIGQCPRYIIEMVGIVLLSFTTLILSEGAGGLGESIPVLGALAVAAQRLLPLVQQIYAAWSGLRGGAASISDALDLLDQKALLNNSENNFDAVIQFKNSLEIKGLSFKYSDNEPLVLSGINLSILKGQRIGLIGKTGSGKSTFMDVFMGLLQKKSGSFLMDSVEVDLFNNPVWMKRIAHVPQSIYLTDASIAENIAFGVSLDLIDYQRLRSVAQKSEILDLVDSWPDGFKTIIGERGAKLSGGQRQRIGIARALYKRADIIVLDEATSALDSHTESLVMKTINQLDRDVTILMIAHRLSSLDFCDVIYEVVDGSLSLYKKMN